MENIRASKDTEWVWITSQPKFIIDFLHNGEVLGALVQRTKKMCHESVLNDKVIELRGTTILHKLSQFPLNDDQMTSIMDILKIKEIDPSIKDANGHTFLELSPIVDKLSRRIYIAHDSWIKSLWKTPAGVNIILRI